MRRVAFGFFILVLINGGLACVSVLTGPAGLHFLDIAQALGGGGERFAQDILWQIRIPKFLAAVFAGFSLSVSGLVLQSVFRNPLAGPFVLGISSGANLGVALVLLAGIGAGSLGVVPAAAVCAFGLVLLILFASRFVAHSISLLIIGLMLGYFVDAIVSFLMATSSSEALRGFVSWGLGSFSRLSLAQAPAFALTTFVGGILCAASVRYLNAAQVGDSFARSLGVPVKFSRMVSLFGASLLAAGATVYCGPIGFVGLASPHIAYGIFRSSNHRILLPASALVGSALSLLAGLVPGVPLSSVTSLFGAPIVLWIFLRARRGGENA